MAPKAADSFEQETKYILRRNYYVCNPGNCLQTLFDMGYISVEEYKAGLWFKEEHSRRFDNISSSYHEQAEYKAMCRKLRKQKYLMLITSLCAFNHKPIILQYLEKHPRRVSQSLSDSWLIRRVPSAWYELQHISKGLQLIHNR